MQSQAKFRSTAKSGQSSSHEEDEAKSSVYAPAAVMKQTQQRRKRSLLGNLRWFLRLRVPLCDREHIPEYRRVEYVHKSYRGFPPPNNNNSNSNSNNSNNKNNNNIDTHNPYENDEDDCHFTFFFCCSSHSHGHSHAHTLHDKSKHASDYDAIYIPWLYCLRSLFSVHNETANVWSHLFGGFFFLWHAVQPGITGAPVGVSVVKTVFCIFSACSFFGSAVFHWFNPVSRKFHWRLRVLDFTGIAFNIIGSQIPLLYYGFYCSPHSSFLYTSYSLLLVSLAAFGIVFPFFDVFHSPHMRNVRVWLFVIMAAFPLWFMTHVAWIYGSFANETSPLFLSLGLTYATYVAGLFFYVSRVPERIFPGKFDVWLNSHQIWHCIAVCGASVWLNGFDSFMHWRLSTPCML